MQNIKITSRGIKLTKANKIYLQEKIGKHEKLLEKATLISTEIKVETTSGVKIIKIQINVNLPQAFIKVEEQGKDYNAVIDKLETILFRRLKRYHDLYNKWQGKRKWKIAKRLSKKSKQYPDTESYKDYEPYIKKYKIYEDDSPKHPAEAIESMELMGATSYLFRNIENNKHCMVCKKENGEYVLVEPPNK